MGATGWPLMGIERGKTYLEGNARGSDAMVGS